ncbi:hypothetical protein [Streptomyces sp. NPDC086787]|uniref:hypothetical protein n=1 Tax=Streptomyces sp. NPDC086787 TaxID=3365759 RepID=UPI00380D4E87
MPALTRQLKISPLLVAAGTCLSLLSYSGTAHAGDEIPGGGSQNTKPGPSGSSTPEGTIAAGASGVEIDRSRNGTGASVGPVASTTSWTPPACWYAPKYTPDQLQKVKEPVWEADSTGYQWDALERDRYVNGKPYKDFNKDKADKGYWWDSFVNESFPPGWDKCTEETFWVDKGDPPPANVANAVTPEILAGIAYNEIRVPTSDASLAPANTTKVNLATWAWLDDSTFKPVSVTASVPLLGISATTTAEPVSLRIDPGTSDAQLYPASGVCEIRNGHIGEEFAKGKADRTPPCGVKYLRSSGNGSYQLRATVTWKIHWTGSGGAGDDLPDGTFGGPQDVKVQEIQSVVR